MLLKTKYDGFTAVKILTYGQLLSSLGSSMATTALTLWLWSTFNSVEYLSIFALLTFAPIILFSPFAGAMVDRMQIKSALAISDAGCAVVNFIIIFFLTGSHFDLIYIYILTFLQGILISFQFPSYSVATSLLVSEEDYSKSNGLLSFSKSVPVVIAPALGGLLYKESGIVNVLLLDALSFLLPLTALYFIIIPYRPTTATQFSFLGNVTYGFRYLSKYNHLFYMVGLFFIYNFITATVAVLQIPILTEFKNGEYLVGLVRSSAALGSVVAGIILLRIKPPSKKVRSIFLFINTILVFSYIIASGLNIEVLWIICSFVSTLLFLMANTYNQSIWQKLIDPTIQGRVFSARMLLAQISIPLANALAAPLTILTTHIIKRTSSKSFINRYNSDGSISERAVIIILSLLGILACTLLYTKASRSKGLQDV